VRRLHEKKPRAPARLAEQAGGRQEHGSDASFKRRGGRGSAPVSSVARARGGEGSRAKRRAAHPELEEELGETGGGLTEENFSPASTVPGGGSMKRTSPLGLSGSIHSAGRRRRRRPTRWTLRWRFSTSLATQAHGAHSGGGSGSRKTERERALGESQRRGKTVGRLWRVRGARRRPGGGLGEPRWRPRRSARHRAASGAGRKTTPRALVGWAEEVSWADACGAR